MPVALPALVQAQGAAKPAALSTPSDIEFLKQKIKADKKLAVADNLVLTEGEANGFRPLFDEYDKGLAEVNQRRGQAIRAYAGAYHERSTATTSRAS
ncbi:MAG: hypothetical protein U5L03_08820 [Burkholderiaceae bacterium]|nr:hypothetical protein [Burkholderiaceae bacterium]